MASTSVDDTKLPYHERQKLAYCGLHALNALLQDEYGAPFTLDTLNDAASEAAAATWALQGESVDESTFVGRLASRWRNPYVHWSGIGNYDVTVLLKCLDGRGLTGAWLSAEQPLVHLPPACIGVLVNDRAGGVWGTVFRARHWIALRCVGGVWWDCDSQRDAPVRLGSQADAITAAEAWRKKGATLIAIVPKPGSGHTDVSEAYSSYAGAGEASIPHAPPADTAFARGTSSHAPTTLPAPAHCDVVGATALAPTAATSTSA
ncbi:hypothetical protein EON62_01315 [archaeon]|nr:MAG: hypothetical protein EON62_01315 [archaeon]